MPSNSGNVGSKTLVDDVAGNGSLIQCSLRREMPVNPSNLDSKCMSMMCRAISGRPYLACPDDPRLDGDSSSLAIACPPVAWFSPAWCNVSGDSTTPASRVHAGIARHVIGCHSTQYLRVPCAFNDIAANTCQALPNRPLATVPAGLASPTGDFGVGGQSSPSSSPSSSSSSTDS